MFLAIELVQGVSLSRLIKEAQHEPGGLRRADGRLHLLADLRAASPPRTPSTAPDGSPLGLVHRDLTPGNVLVSFDGVVKIIDFGIAKAEERITHTRTGQLKGKPSYMAPEQQRGGQVDARADLFSFGVRHVRDARRPPALDGEGRVRRDDGDRQRPAPRPRRAAQRAEPRVRRHRPQVPREEARGALRRAPPRSRRGSTPGSPPRASRADDQQSLAHFVAAQLAAPGQVVAGGAARRAREEEGAHLQGARGEDRRGAREAGQGRASAPPPAPGRAARRGRTAPLHAWHGPGRPRRRAIGPAPPSVRVAALPARARPRCGLRALAGAAASARIAAAPAPSSWPSRRFAQSAARARPPRSPSARAEPVAAPRASALGPGLRAPRPAPMRTAAPVRHGARRRRRASHAPMPPGACPADASTGDRRPQAAQALAAAGRSRSPATDASAPHVAPALVPGPARRPRPLARARAAPGSSRRARPSPRGAPAAGCVLLSSSCCVLGGAGARRVLLRRRPSIGGRTTSARRRDPMIDPLLGLGAFALALLTLPRRAPRSIPGPSAGVPERHAPRRRHALRRGAAPLRRPAPRRDATRTASPTSRASPPRRARRPTSASAWTSTRRRTSAGRSPT